MKLILTTNNGLLIEEATVTKAQLEEAVLDETAALELLQRFDIGED